MSFGLRKQIDVSYSQNFGNALKIHSPSQAIIPNTQLYALKRRLFVPSWWLLGTLLSHGSREAWFDHLAYKHVGRTIAAPMNVTSKNILVLLSIWHEIITQVLSNRTDEENQIRFEISSFLLGTKKDNQEICSQIESIWSCPLRLFEVKPSPTRQNSALLSQFGNMSFSKQAHVTHDVDGIWLTLDLTQSCRQTCQPIELSRYQDLQHNLISLNPTVIRSMGAKASMKKVLHYLFLEYSKHLHDNKDQWNSFAVKSHGVSAFHKDMLSHCSSLYDHGILGWNNSAPAAKISHIKSQYSNDNLSSPVVFSWPISQQAEQAYQLESSLSSKLMSLDQQTHFHEKPFVEKKTLFPEPPPDELRRLREKTLKEKMPPSDSKKRRTFDMQTLFDDSSVRGKAISKADVITDTEFMILVSEFYESLKPMQKKAFENERRGMTQDQFRSYMMPILQKKRSSFFNQ